MNSRGQVLPLVAICLAVLMGFAGMAVDIGYIEYQQRQQQSAADAAAIGGARQLIYSGCGAASAATTAANTDAASNGYTNGSHGVTVSTTLGSQLPSGPFAGNACAVQVQVTATHTPFFSKLFGFQGLVTTQAVAMVTPSLYPTCLDAVDSKASVNDNGGSIDASGCTIALDGTANFNGARVTAGTIGYAGSKPNENGATFSEASPAPMLPFADPCPEITGCAYLANNPPSTSPCTGTYTAGTTTLNPGCYQSLNLNGGTVTLNPGLYILNGSTNFNGATVTGTGVTLYVTSSGSPPNFNGATVSLTPPTSGSETGVLYYQVPANTSSPNFNGAQMSLSGLLYAPTATSVNFNGSGGGYTLLVFGSANFNGSNVTFPTPAPGGSLIKQAVLAE